MTSAPFTPGDSDSDEHPEVEEISTFAEGLLSPDRSAEVREHLRHCVLCADVRDSLDSIRDTLGSLPGPPTMPADVAGRIDAALAAETLLDATGPDSEAAGEPAPSKKPRHAAHPEPSEQPHTDAAAGSTEAPSHSADSTTPLSERDVTSAAATRVTDQGSVSRETVPTAVSRETRDRPPGRPHASTGPGRGKGTRRPRRRTAVLVAAGAVCALGLGGVLVQSLTGSEQNPTATDEAALKKQVHSLLASPSTDNGSAPPTMDTKQSPPSTRDSTLRGGSAGVPSCVRAGIERVRDTGSDTDRPLATNESARYKDGSGYLVVLPHHGGGQQQVDVYVVDRACVSRDSSGPGDVLLQRTYQRH